jgi:hypothetical protein
MGVMEMDLLMDLSPCNFPESTSSLKNIPERIALTLKMAADVLEGGKVLICNAGDNKAVIYPLGKVAYFLDAGTSPFNRNISLKYESPEDPAPGVTFRDFAFVAGELGSLMGPRVKLMAYILSSRIAKLAYVLSNLKVDPQVAWVRLGEDVSLYKVLQLSDKALAKVPAFDHPDAVCVGPDGLTFQ